MSVSNLLLVQRKHCLTCDLGMPSILAAKEINVPWNSFEACA